MKKCVLGLLLVLGCGCLNAPAEDLTVAELKNRIETLEQRLKELESALNQPSTVELQKRALTVDEAEVLNQKLYARALMTLMEAWPDLKNANSDLAKAYAFQLKAMDEVNDKWLQRPSDLPYEVMMRARTEIAHRKK